MWMRVVKLSGLAVLAVAVGSLAAVAQPTGRSHGPGGAGMARYLGLSADQQTQLKALHDEQRPQIQTLGQQLRENHERLQQALEAASPDPAAVGTIVIQGHALQQQMRKLHADADQAVRALLSPDQQTKFDALQALRGERGPMGRGWGRGFGPPPGGVEK